MTAQDAVISAEVALRRRIFNLEARCVELEHQLRRSRAEDDVRVFELQAAQREIFLLQGYIRELQDELGRLHLHAVAVSEDRDRVARRMHQLERELAAAVTAGPAASPTALRLEGLLDRLRHIKPLWALLRIIFRLMRAMRRALRSAGRRFGRTP